MGVVAVAVLFAIGERSARESAEREMEAAIQLKVAAQEAATLAEEDKDKAIQQKVAAQEAATLAEEERDRAVQRKVAAEEAASQAWLERAWAVRDYVAAQRAADLAEKEKAQAVQEAIAAQRAADLAEKEKAQAIQEAIAAQRAAGLAEKEKAQAIQEAIAAQRAADLAEKEKTQAVQEATVAQRAVKLAEDEKETALRAAEEADRKRVAQEKARILEMAKTHPLVKAVVTGELKFYIEPLPSFAGESVSRAVEEVAESFSTWSRYGANVTRVYSISDADLTVGWVRDYGTHVLGQAIFAAHIKVGLGTTNCIDEWMAFDPDTIKKILWHELGHSMGYGHSTDADNVMYESTDTRFVVDHEISKVIAGGWYYYFPLCGSGEPGRCGYLRASVLLLSALRFRRVLLLV